MRSIAVNLMSSWKQPALFATLVLVLLLPACDGTAPAPNQQGGAAPTNLTVRTFLESLDTPAADGVVIRLDGAEVGVTAADGTLTITAANGTHQVRAFKPGLSGGAGTIDLSADATLDVIMTGGGLREDTELKLDQFRAGVAGNILDEDFTAVTLRFVDDAGQTVPLTDLDYVYAEPRNGGHIVNLTSFFELQPDGTIEATDPEGLRNELQAVEGEIAVWASANDADGLVHVSEVKFYLGRYTVSGTLAAPPSNPDLPVDVAGITVQATFLTLGGGNIVFTTTTDATGAFAFSRIPIGSLVFEVTVQDGGLIYNGFGNVAVDANLGLVVVLLTTEDILNGLPSITVSQLAGRPPEGPADPARVAADAAHTADPVHAALTGETLDASVTVTSDQEAVPVHDGTVLYVPQGTPKVTLTYVVSSAEYPRYVNQQSEYDDVWELRVFARDGGMLVDISRRVNAMLNEAPKWQSDGTTGEITQELDISAATAASDTEIILYVSSTNVGDWRLATTVTATVSFDTAFNISDAKADKVDNWKKKGHPAKVDSDYYSLPEFAESNTFHRIFTLTLAGRPPGGVVTGVTVDAFQESNPKNQIFIYSNQPVDGVLVKEIDALTLEVRVTQDLALTMDPDRIHNIRYRFKIYLDVDGTELETPEKESGRCHGLYRMPKGFLRVGPADPDEKRDVGGDDWVSRGCYQWMDWYRDKLTRINDVSGEHARNIGHHEHKEGTDIDMYHFTHLLGGADPVGGKNYAELVRLTKIPLRCELTMCSPEERAVAEKAVDDLKKWFTTARTRLADLADMPTVTKLYFMKGWAHDNLPEGWAEALLLTGKVKDTDGMTLDLGLGSWSRKNVFYDHIHNNHVHVGLNKAALRQAPYDDP